MKRLLASILTVALLLAGLPAYAAADYQTHWAAGVILRAYSAGIISGDTDGDFYPDRDITRAEFVSIVARRLNLSGDSTALTFSDVKLTDWYAPAVAATVAADILSGYPDNTFRPAESISRQEAVFLLCRAFGAEPEFSASLLRFVDFVEVASYAQESMAFAVSQGLVSGYEDAMLRPRKTLTRAEALVLCEKFYTYFSGLEEKTVDFMHGYPVISQTGEENRINITVKTNQPCTVRYMAVNLETGNSKFTPTKEMITGTLVPVERANTEYYCSIAAEPNTRYNIFLLAVAADGTAGKIHALKNVTALPFTEGKGTAENPYRIYTAFQLDQIRNFPKQHFRLAADIALTEPWTPIGSSEEQTEMFSGSLDGAGHKISNLQIKNDSRYAGLFSYIFGGTVRNLTVEVNISAKSDAGGIAGHLEGGRIENCTVTGLVAAESTNAGGIAGTNAGAITNCLSAVYVTESRSYAGGIAGRNTGTIQNCLSAVHAVTADMYAGGIAGANFGGTVEGCVAANMRTTDILTANSGRITTNRSGGKTVNNYGYDRMISNTNVSLDADNNQDGEDVSWKNLLDAGFYQSLGWDMNTCWQMPKKENAAFLLPVLRSQPAPALIAGRTPYAPSRIYTVRDLQQIQENPDGHYLVAANITLSESIGSWTPLCLGTEGFTGTLDGNGHTISGLQISDSEQTGLFAEIGGGTVRNLQLTDVNMETEHTAGGIAAVNYGYIENCTVSGTLTVGKTTQTVSAGGICGVNAGMIENVQSKLQINITGASVSAGGVVGQNEGFVDVASFQGSMQAENNASNLQLGGIAGMNSDGYIYNTYANVQMRANAEIGYLGGICGLQTAGELYKCSAKGTMYTAAESKTASSVYAGGICGMADTGLIMHSFSTIDISAQAETVYNGGICGFSTGAAIQNTYATGTISANGFSASTVPNVYAGGICGYNEAGFINGSVTMSPSINTSGASGKICAYTAPAQVSDVYAYINTACSGLQLTSAENGTAVSGSTLKDDAFFFAPSVNGGKLGWSSQRYDGTEGVWTMEVPGKGDYVLPLLSGVPQQNTFIMPALR